MREEAKNSAELISDYGKAVLFTLAGKELKLEAALDILQKNRIGSEKAVLKRKFLCIGTAQQIKNVQKNKGK